MFSLGTIKKMNNAATSQLRYFMPTKPSRPFKKGDFVDAMNGDHTRMGTHRVVRVTKTRVKTECGRTWDQRGWWVGENGIWPYPWIRHSRRKRIVAVD